ncbi:MAG: SH3 domain-containing protein, partial [Deltaproteobacteria bacterium]|nr:SH3 domain-containing protein [Deltaproteobacteria bacterium]
MRNSRLSQISLLLLCLALSLTQAACATPPYNYGTTDEELSADLKHLPQDLNAYLGDPQYADLPLLGEQARSEAAGRARERFFAPWQPKAEPVKIQEAMWGMYALKPERGFAENLRPYPRERWEALKENCAAETYPNAAILAVTVRQADQRLMPTSSPYFFDPARAGQGYPFDYLQTSSLPPGSPVLISHLSKDGQWALAESASAVGWVEIGSLARVDEAFMKFWTGAPLAAVTAEGVQLADGKAGNAKRPAEALAPLAVSAGIGTLLPCKSAPNGALTVYFPERNPDGSARISACELSTAPAPEQAAPWPLALTRRNLAALGNKLIARPYGWGGYGGNRDCSSLLRDLFLPFGLWLPRNSAAQANIGQKTDLTGLRPRAREKAILEEGRPFLSLIAMPGHIGLYLGAYEERPVMFHALWRIRTVRRSLFGRNLDRNSVVGKAVITTLTPGAERKDIGSPNSLLDRVSSINHLPR